MIVVRLLCFGCFSFSHSPPFPRLLSSAMHYDFHSSSTAEQDDRNFWIPYNSCCCQFGVVCTRSRPAKAPSRAHTRPSNLCRVGDRTCRRHKGIQAMHWHHLRFCCVYRPQMHRTHRFNPPIHCPSILTGLPGWPAGVAARSPTVTAANRPQSHAGGLAINHHTHAHRI